MLPEQYQELDELRKYLNVKSKQKLANQLKIREIRGVLGTARQDFQEELNNKRYEMEIDKEKRASYGLTNQTDWKRKIRELTKEDEEKIAAATQDLEDEIERLSDENDVIRIRLEDTRWELTLKTELYKTSDELVQIIAK